MLKVKKAITSTYSESTIHCFNNSYDDITIYIVMCATENYIDFGVFVFEIFFMFIERKMFGHRFCVSKCFFARYYSL